MSRSNVFQFRPGNEEVRYKDYAKVLRSPKIRDRVQKVVDETVKVSQGRGRIVIETPDFERLETGLPMGTLQPHPSRKGAIAVHEDFPQTLLDEGLEREHAIEVAAASAVAYGGLSNWLSGLRREQQQAVAREATHVDMQPQYPQLWEADTYNPIQLGAKQSLHMVTHRAAARIALAAAELDEADEFDPKHSPLPVHITALADPLTKRQVQALHDQAGL